MNLQPPSGRLLTLLILFTVIAIPVSAPAAIPVTGPATIAVPGEYALQNDVINAPFTRPWNGILINASGVWLDGMGHTIDGDKEKGGLMGDDINGILVFSPIGLTHTNITIKNVTVARCINGIILVKTAASRVHHVGAWNNSPAGIYLFESDENQIYECDAFGNHIGIYPNTSNRNGIANNTLRSNYWGIETDEIRDTIIINNTATENIIGIGLWNSSSNTVTENTISGTGNAGEGLALYESAGNNLLTRNRVSGHNTGILIDPHQTGADRIFDNHFNTPVSAVIYSATQNTWNTTFQPGRNIIGGRNTGGNYWAAPNGSGFSQTHPDTDGDGIAASEYVLSPGNTDHLPLAKSPLSPLLVPGALVLGGIAISLMNLRTGKNS